MTMLSAHPVGLFDGAAPPLTQRERELGAIVTAYNEVTDRLKIAHERLGCEVSRLREELKQKNEELRRRERLAALGEMAAGLAHEIRNPLGGIALYASMLERELTGQASAATAGKIFHGVRSLEKLVCEILDFAQEQRLERRLCRLDSMIAQMECGAARALEAGHATMNVEFAEGLVSAYCDPERVSRVLLNLVLNAIEASKSGARVQIVARRMERGVQIEVLDEGPGIPEDLLPRIFNPFVTTKASGTGLGLAISHRIIEAHGGSLRVVNRPEGGARFSMWLPDEKNSETSDGIEAEK